jgi:hypothetical protein
VALNIAMASFVVILFWRDREFSASEVLLPRKLSLQTVVLTLFGVMPVFSFFGLWDSYLSAALYSGNVPNALIYLNEATRERLPPGIQDQVRTGPDGRLQLNPYTWSLVELNAPGYPERRVFLNVARKICIYAADPSAVSLVIYAKPSLLHGSRETHTYNCSDL